MSETSLSRREPQPISDHWNDNEPVLQGHHLENDHPVPVFGTRDRWDLRALGWNPAMGRSSVAIRFTGFDAPAWNLRARELAMALLNPTHSALRSRLIYRTNVPNHPKTVGMKINGLRRFVEWFAQTLPDRGLDELRQHHLDAFLIDLKSQGRSSSTRMAIAALRDLHTFGDVLTGGGFSFRPWGDITADALSGRSRTTAELTTPVIPPNVWWPLLRACWQYIDVFSHDIFAAEAEWDALSQKSTGKESAGLVDDELVEWMSRPSSAIPVHRITFGRFREGEIHWTLLSLLVTNGRRKDAFASDAVPACAARRRMINDAIAAGALQTRPGGLLTSATSVQRADGTSGPWIDGFDPATIRTQRKLLRNACYVFTAALTMMRDSELLAIQRGALTTFYGAPAVSSRLRKKRRGHHAHSWWIIEPVAQAIAVAERLSFSDTVFGSTRQGRGDGQTLTHFDQHDELRKFVRQVNALGPNSALETIPDFHLSPHMFRRTMSIITAQQPDGEIALGIQLKHAAKRAVANSTTSGYASETPEWAAEFEHELQEAVAARLAGMWSNGQSSDVKLAGAGAQRFREGIAAVDAAVVSEPAVMVGDDRLLRTLLRDQFSTLRWGTVNHCLGIPEQAACLKGVPAEVAKQGVMPNRCQPTTCGNSVVTDEHAPIWIAEEQDLVAKLKDRRMAAHNREQLENELRDVRKITKRLSDA
jgi:integrase